MQTIRNTQNIAQKEAVQKIALFIGILVTVVLAINI